MIVSSIRETPILMSPPMALGSWNGAKTQTRRVMERQKQHDFTDYTLFGQEGHNEGDWKAIEHAPDWPDGKEDQCFCPYARRRGDRLWVKEEHYLWGHWVKTGIVDGRQRWRFSADKIQGVLFERPEGVLTKRGEGDYGWWKRNSLFMPRWACRTVLEVTQLRVERLQDISEDDCRAEGIDREHWEFAPRGAYRNLWESINGYDTWDLNPHVWAVSFKKVA